MPVTGTFAESVAVTVNKYEPAVLAPGVPWMYPTLAVVTSDSPAGSNPDVTV